MLANSNVDYRRPILWPDDLIAELFVERIGDSSLTPGHRLLSAADQSLLYADGSVVMVWIGTGTGASVPLPEAMRAACSAA